MRQLKLLLLFVTSGLLACAVEYTHEVRVSLSKIRKEAVRDGLPCLEGHTGGAPGRYGAYMVYFPRIYGNATRQDIELMLKDSNPVIRLIGARIALNYGPINFDVSRLSGDTARLWVGPFRHSKENFRQMTVAEVLLEMRNDPLFELRFDYGESVQVDYIKPIGAQESTKLILGKLPEYPFEMAAAAIAGDVTARIVFKKDSVEPEIRIVKSRHREFDEATTWALSKWRINPGTPPVANSADTLEFECRIKFTLDDE